MEDLSKPRHHHSHHSHHGLHDGLLTEYRTVGGYHNNLVYDELNPTTGSDEVRLTEPNYAPGTTKSWLIELNDDARPGWMGGVLTVFRCCLMGILVAFAALLLFPIGAQAVSAVLAAPATNQGNYATGCRGGSCRTFDDHWTSSTLSTAAWFPGLIINGQYIDGGIGLTNPYSAWTICDCNGGTNTVFLDYGYGYPTNTVGANFVPLQKAADGSLQFSLGLNSYFTGNSNAAYIGGAISSSYSAATEITHTGGLMQWRSKFDDGLQYGSYPGMQCSATGANGADGFSYNANFEFGYTWTGTPLTDVAFGVNNLTADTSNGGTLETGVMQVPSTNDLTQWHTFGVEYTGDTGTRKWQYYVDGVLQDTASATQPPGTDFNCSWQIFNAPSVDDGWHSAISSSNPGPFSLWISDIQFYKKPGT